jgi:transketolase
VQSDTWVEDVSDLGPLAQKVEAFGWAVETCDGNDIGAFASTLASLRERAPDRPKLIVADTEKGSGVSFMTPGELPHGGDELYAFHSGAPTPEHYEAGVDEIHARLDSRLASLGLEPIEPVTAEGPSRPAPKDPQRLIPAYADALADIGEQHSDVVVLDADLVLDTGLIPFRKRFPERFFECGIAEQDMVSQAGAMALTGLVPIVHSFGCFLAPRPNEQIHNNATEETKVVYVGSLVGIVPGGPGHSHQSVRDISALGAMPGMSLIEPATEDEVAAALRWAVEEAPGPVYIRLVSVPWELGFEAPPAAERLTPGQGRVVRSGAAGTFVTTGPVMLSQAYAAAERLDFTVVALPWLRGVDGDWLAELAGEGPVVTVDNHYVDGGQGDAVLRALAAVGAPNRVLRVGVERVPYGGTNDEVLRAHELDAEGLVGRVEAALATA